MPGIDWFTGSALHASLGGAVAGMRHFGTGATRDQDTTKPDYEGFISPLVTKRFGQYMNRHRTQPDGSVRDSANWQLGIPKDAYIKSAVRHMEDWKLHHRGYGDEAVELLEDSLCALIFNASGYLLELLKERRQRVSAALHEDAKALGASLLKAPGQLE